MAVDYRNLDDDAEWFQNGPTTHLTTDGETSVCGQADVGDNPTHEVEGGEYLCNRCAELASRA